MKLNLTIFSFGFTGSAFGATFGFMGSAFGARPTTFGFMGSAFGARPTTFGFTGSAFGLGRSSHLFLIRTAGTAGTAGTTGTGIATHGNMSFETIGTSLASTSTS